MPAHAVPALSRSRLIEMSMLRYLASCLTLLAFPGHSYEHYWRGDRRVGAFGHADGQGNGYGLAWDAETLSVSAYDHDSAERNLYTDPAKQRALENPHHFFEDSFPAELVEQLREAARARNDRSDTRPHFDPTNTSAVLWTRGEEVFVPEPWDTAFDQGLWFLEAYGLTPREALVGTGEIMGWGSRASFPESISALCLSLHGRLLAVGRVELTDEISPPLPSRTAAPTATRSAPLPSRSRRPCTCSRASASRP